MTPISKVSVRVCHIAGNFDERCTHNGVGPLLAITVFNRRQIGVCARGCVRAKPEQSK